MAAGVAVSAVVVRKVCRRAGAEVAALVDAEDGLLRGVGVAAAVVVDQEVHALAVPDGAAVVDTGRVPVAEIGAIEVASAAGAAVELGRLPRAQRGDGRAVGYFRVVHPADLCAHVPLPVDAVHQAAARVDPTEDDPTAVNLSPVHHQEVHKSLSFFLCRPVVEVERKREREREGRRLKFETLLPSTFNW